MKMMLILPIVYVAANGYLFWRVLQAMSGLPVWVKIIIGVLFWTAAFSLFISIGMRNVQVPEIVLKTMFRIGSIWLVFLLYSVLLLIFFDILRLIVPSVGPALRYALPLTCALLVYGYVNYLHPKVEHIDITLDKEFEGGGFTAVAVSDIHLGYGTGPKMLKRYVDLINAQKPDAVLIAGDLIDNSIRPVLNAPYADILAGIEAPVYMVPGNHEYISGIKECAAYIDEQTGIKLLRDSIMTLPNGIQVVGRDDRSNRGRLPLADLLEDVSSDRPVIVLDHQPYDLAKTVSLGVDIQISGHTHRGQVWPLSRITDIMYEQSHGYRKWRNSHIYVSSGLSLWGPPFRIGSSSDLAVLKIRK